MHEPKITEEIGVEGLVAHFGSLNLIFNYSSIIIQAVFVHFHFEGQTFALVAEVV